ncbi:MAG: hypothetical protein BWY26_00064 [Elusimicrobia bacterium ADurb.Bin231]|nr:MAG: hypothetical protein BWY26_00064 [Elusimicrobia bacterium ADurb.Bin231]
MLSVNSVILYPALLKMLDNDLTIACSSSTSIILSMPGSRAFSFDSDSFKALAAAGIIMLNAVPLSGSL